MSFAVVCIAALAGLGIIAAIASRIEGGADEPVSQGHDCASCASADDGSCQLHCIIEEQRKKKKKDNQ